MHDWSVHSDGWGSEYELQPHFLEKAAGLALADATDKEELKQLVSRTFFTTASE
jgi:hypothetical protein